MQETERPVLPGKRKKEKERRSRTRDRNHVSLLAAGEESRVFVVSGLLFSYATVLEGRQANLFPRENPFFSVSRFLRWSLGQTEKDVILENSVESGVTVVPRTAA